MSLIARALGVLRSRRLKRFTGTDLKVIERKVTDYYASHSGEAYYARLAEQHIGDDFVTSAALWSTCLPTSIVFLCL